MNRIIISKQNNPYVNIALEKHIFDKFEEGITLYLWQNAPSVIIGRNQNLLSECNMPYLLEHDIFPVRRFTGGGAVYHDMGNVNFTFVTKETDTNTKIIHQVVKDAINLLGIECEFSGRNDMLCDGKKFSGHAYLAEEGKLMYHGTIMANVKFEMLERAITPSNLKLKSKGIASVRSRVMNLSEKDKEITVKRVKEAFLEAFRDKIDIIQDNIIFFQEECDNEEIKKMAEELASNDWLYGQSPEYDITVEKRIGGQNVVICMNVKSGVISEVKVETDSLCVDFSKKCEQALLGQCYFPGNIDLIIEKITNL